MAVGHIKIGNADDLRWYLLTDPKARTKTLANPMAAKLGEGSGDYNDFQNWSAFLMEDWTTGLGKKDPSDGGFLYGTLDTRFPNRLVLATRPSGQTDGSAHYNDTYQQIAINTEVSVGNDSTIKRISQRFEGAGVGTNGTVLIWLKNENKSVTIECFTNSGGKPSVIVGSADTLTTNDNNSIGYSLYSAYFGGAFTHTTVYHIVVRPTTSTDTISVPANSTGVANRNNTYDGAAWNAYSSAILVAGFMPTGSNDTNACSKVVLFNSTIYGASGAKLFKLDPTGWTTISTFGATISDLCVVGSTLYIGLGSSTVLQTMSTLDALTVGSVAADKMALWNEYLWRSVNNTVYYSGDGVTWSGPFTVCRTSGTVNGMAGSGDDLYVATSFGLVFVGAGNQIISVSEWPGIGTGFGKRMHNFQGDLYIPQGRSLIRYGNGVVLPMGPDLGEGLPSDRDGTIAAVTNSNYWLFVGVNNSAGGRSMVLGWNGQGWHHICTLPAGSGTWGIYDMVYVGNATSGGSTIISNTLYIATDYGSIFSVYIPDRANFSTSDAYYLAPCGWLETDWFSGGLKEISKDFESVYVTGDNIDTNNYVEVYWKDDDSTTWELLGTVTSPRTELRWSSTATRPNSKQIKIGVMLYSKTRGSSPIVRAIRVKFQSMVLDRFRWTLPIALSDLQDMPDNKVNPYTAQQMKAHIETLLTQIPPFILQDIYGESDKYEVKVLSATESPTSWEYINGKPRIMSVYNLTVEQATTGKYTG
jgi:hypothetical protein